MMRTTRDVSGSSCSSVMPAMIDTTVVLPPERCFFSLSKIFG